MNFVSRDLQHSHTLPLFTGLNLYMMKVIRLKLDFNQESYLTQYLILFNLFRSLLLVTFVEKIVLTPDLFISKGLHNIKHKQRSLNSTLFHIIIRKMFLINSPIY